MNTWLRRTWMKAFMATLAGTAGACGSADDGARTEPVPQPLGATETAAGEDGPGDRDAVMQSMMADHDHRMFHFLWHGIRNSWPRMSLSQKAQVRSVLGAAWGRNDSETTNNPQPGAGEEFLHMHRIMVVMVRDLLAAQGISMYEAWARPPSPSDTRFPLPRNPADLDAISWNTYVALTQMDTTAKDPAVLRRVTLSNYSLWLEQNLHNTMHMRWADNNDFYGSPSSIFSNPTAAQRAAWDPPRNRYLGGTYTSQVHPYFWALHGYVDARIDDWLRANGYTSAAESCEAPCYQWRRTWTGPLPMVHGQGGEGAEHPDLSRAFSELDDEVRELIVQGSSFPHPAPNGKSMPQLEP